MNTPIIPTYEDLLAIIYRKFLVQQVKLESIITTLSEEQKLKMEEKIENKEFRKKVVEKFAKSFSIAINDPEFLKAFYKKIDNLHNSLSE